jgi:hypothetical protein
MRSFAALNREKSYTTKKAMSLKTHRLNIITKNRIPIAIGTKFKNQCRLVKNMTVSSASLVSRCVQVYPRVPGGTPVTVYQLCQYHLYLSQHMIYPTQRNNS